MKQVLPKLVGIESHSRNEPTCWRYIAAPINDSKAIISTPLNEPTTWQIGLMQCKVRDFRLWQDLRRWSTKYNNRCPDFENEVKGGNPYIVTYNWKSILTIKIITLSSVSTTSLAEMAIFQSLPERWHAAILDKVEVHIYKLHHRFYFTLPLKQYTSENGITIKKL